MRVPPIPDAFPASSSTELLALPHLIAQPPLPSQRLEASFLNTEASVAHFVVSP